MKNHLIEKRLSKNIKIISKLKANDSNILSSKLQDIMEKKENVRYKSWITYLTKEMKKQSVESR